MVNSVVNSVMRKPFTCPVCATGFTRQDNLRAHMKRHGDGEVEGPEAQSDNSRSPGPTAERTTDSPMMDNDGKVKHCRKIFFLLVATVSVPYLGPVRKHFWSH